VDFRHQRPVQVLTYSGFLQNNAPKSEVRPLLSDMVSGPPSPLSSWVDGDHKEPDKGAKQIWDEKIGQHNSDSLYSSNQVWLRVPRRPSSSRRDWRPKPRRSGWTRTHWQNSSWI